MKRENITTDYIRNALVFEVDIEYIQKLLLELKRGKLVAEIMEFPLDSILDTLDEHKTLNEFLDIMRPQWEVDVYHAKTTASISVGDDANVETATEDP